MKIEIKLNNDALIAVSKMLQKIYNLPVSVDKVENVYKSIGYNLADAFDKKVKAKVRKSDLFDQKKLTKFSFPFHEAWALHKLLIELKPYGETEFASHQIQTVIDKLDPKIC